MKVCLIIGLVVQLVRIPACHAGGREFESRPDRNPESSGAKIALRNWSFFLPYNEVVLCP